MPAGIPEVCRPAAPSALPSLVGRLALALVAACASSPEPERAAPVVVYPSIERACVSADGRSGRSAARAAYMIDAPGGRPAAPLAERECFFPWVDAAGWARVQSLPGAAYVPRSVAIGLVGDEAAGGASFEIGANRTITRATLGGPVGLMWTWDELGRTLARVDFVWADARVTVGGRIAGSTRVHLGRLAAGRKQRVWESTVFAAADASGRLQEARVADGPLVFPAPEPHALSGVHPICPLTDHEIWEDFDGRVPRVQRCVRERGDWLRVERDARGRIVAVTESPAAIDGPTATRTLRLTWHGTSTIPATLIVQRDGLDDGLEVRFDTRGVPTLTRHHRLGVREGLEIEWEDARARTARVWLDGIPGPARTIVPRGGARDGRDQPALSIDLPVLPSDGTGTAWIDEP